MGLTASRDIAIEVVPQTTIYNIKLVIQSSNHIPASCQEMYFSGALLEDDKTLQDYNIIHNSNLHMVFTFRGGGRESEVNYKLNPKPNPILNPIQILSYPKPKHPIQSQSKSCPIQNPKSKTLNPKQEEESDTNSEPDTDWL